MAFESLDNAFLQIANYGIANQEAQTRYFISSLPAIVPLILKIKGSQRHSR
jgi:hypothetical protein